MPWEESLANLAQVVALLAVASYFVYRAHRGFFTVDMSLSVDAVRRHSSQVDLDELVVTVTMQRGAHGSVMLRDAVVQLAFDAVVARLDVPDIHRAKRDSDGKLAFPISPHEQGEKMPFLQLTPNETMSFESHAYVSSGSVVYVTVVIQSQLGGRKSRGQWRSSRCILPLGDEPES